MEKIEISSCRRFIGEEWCPAENDGHCMLSDNVETIVETLADNVPYNCPLKKSPILLQLKAEVLMGA